MYKYIAQGAQETLSYAIYLSYLTTLVTCNSHDYHRFMSSRVELNKSSLNSFFLKFFIHLNNT